MVGKSLGDFYSRILRDMDGQILGDFYNMILEGDGGSNFKRILQHDFRGTWWVKF